VIAAGMVVASIGGAAGALGHSYWGLAASRAVVGLGTAAVVPIANSILGQIFEGPLKASRISLFNLGLFLGGVTAYVAGLAFGFPGIVLVLAVPGVLLSIWILALPVPVRRAPSVDLAWWSYLAQFVTRFIADARGLLAIRTLRWLIASTTLMAFAAGGYAAWLAVFLDREKHMSTGPRGEISQLLVLALFGGLAGILTGGRISDRLRRRWVSGRLWTIVLGTGLTIPCAIASLLLDKGPALVAVGVATMFFISWYHAPIAASVDDLAPDGKSVSAQGLVIFTMHMLGTAPSSWVIGEVSQHTDNLTLAMWVPTVALGAAALCMALATTSFAADTARARGTAGAGRGGPL
jgi:MFS family permease